jgi:hypothetical protein
MHSVFCWETKGKSPLGKSTYRYETILDFLRFEVFTEVTMKSVVFWDVTSCGFLRNLCFASIITVIRIGELGTKQQLAT